MVLEVIVPSVLIGILVIVLIVFIIKSLIKFAIFAAAVAFLVYLVWQFGGFQFLKSAFSVWTGF